MSGKEDTEERRRYQAPYSAQHPIPTIAKYREERAARQQEALHSRADVGGTGEKPQPDPGTHTANGQIPNGQPAELNGDDSKHQQDVSQDDGAEVMEDTSQVPPAAADPKRRRGYSNAWDMEKAERQVTDPVTHLPITIQDFTDDALKEVDLDAATPMTMRKAQDRSPVAEKPDMELLKEQLQTQRGHDILANRFPPPSFDVLRVELAAIHKQGVAMGLGGAGLIVLIAFILERQALRSVNGLSWVGVVILICILAATGGAIWALVVATRNWVTQRVENVFDDEVWASQREQLKNEAERQEKETTVWLNSILGAMWPLVNPDLFASLGDTLEDVMQASLPKIIRMVSVDDIGQGGEALRILGVRWLPAGAATESVNEDGTIVSKSGSETSSQGSGKKKERKPSQGKIDKVEGEENEDGVPVSQGLLAEEGEFINLEIAFAYRARSKSRSFKQKTKDMHIYLAFFLPGNVKIPVWVSLQGIVGTMRLRLQLTPDPPFFELCTLTFLGQPKINLSCVPLSKHGLNIMDVPFISNFVQSAVDAAVAQYVAPKSLTLNLKDMLSGEDFKKDTVSKGVLMINIKRGYDFKMGDSGFPLLKNGSSDPYVSVGWAKFGKAISTTRIMISEMEPCWDETFFMLVSADELNVDERLRVELWDSDRFSADDSLGRIEVSLKSIMTGKESNGRIADRVDGFKSLKPGGTMPGKLEWSVGYFSKARIQKCQFEKQTHDPEVRSMEQLKAKVNESCEHKLREAIFKERKTVRKESELAQQKQQELKAEQDAMIISAPPPDDLPSGIFSIQIHNITGLEVEKLSKTDKHVESDDEKERGHDGLPSAYCNIVINHHKAYRTRTKPQNAKPFYNAGCERFIPNWKECDVFVGVRDSRMDEDDPLLGMVHLPLDKIFKERSQVMGTWPLAGGIGHGKVRLSMVWRSVHLHAPRRLLGWDYGTVEIKPCITGHNLPEQILRDGKLKFQTDLSTGKMYGKKHEASWYPKKGKDESIFLAVAKRYSGCLSIAFTDKGLFGDDVAAFSILWLKDIPDEEEQELELPVWEGPFKRAVSNCLTKPGEKIGTIKVKLVFWSGLGAAHSAWARKDHNVRDVVEAISTAQESMDFDKLERKAGIVNEEASSDSDSSDDDDDDHHHHPFHRHRDDEDIPDGSPNDKQGPIDQIKDYKNREQALHRRHRGIMQWKAPRTAKWVKHRVDNFEKRLSGVFDRHTNQTGIETEV